MRNIFKSILFISSVMAGMTFLTESKLMVLISLIVVVSGIYCTARFDRLVEKIEDMPLYLKMLSIVLGMTIPLSRLYSLIRYRDIGAINLFAERLNLNYIPIDITITAISIYSLVFFSKIFINMVIEALGYYNIHLDLGEKFYKNLFSNKFTIIGDILFFLLPCRASVSNILGNVVGGIIAGLCIALLLGQREKYLTWIYKNSKRSIRYFSILSAIGIVENNWIQFINSSLTAYIQSKGIHLIIIKGISLLIALSSYPFVVMALLTFYKIFLRAIKKSGMLEYIKSFSRKEIVFYGIVIIMMLLYIVTNYANSDAFYHPSNEYDIIYTSDSPELLKYNAYLSVTNPENDLRQPLFAVYSALFLGLPYLLSIPFRIFGINGLISAVMFSIVQYIILFFSYIILTASLNIQGRNRALFIFFVHTTFTTLLFTLMLEQYIIGFFWLMFFVYLYINGEKTDLFTTFGAIGTLSTNLPLVFLDSTTILSRKEFNNWIINIKNKIVFLLSFMLLCGKTELLFGLTWKTSAYEGYSGTSISLINKIWQLTDYVAGCFVGQNSVMKVSALNYPSWQLSDFHSFNVVGIVVLLLAIYGCVLNFDRKSAKLGLFYTLFSIFLLGIVGWGTAENGLVLYSLYFLWSYILGIYLLINKISNKVESKMLTPAMLIIAGFINIFLNYTPLHSLINFTIKYYPR